MIMSKCGRLERSQLLHKEKLSARSLSIRCEFFLVLWWDVRFLHELWNKPMQSLHCCALFEFIELAIDLKHEQHFIFIGYFWLARSLTSPLLLLAIFWQELASSWSHVVALFVVVESCDLMMKFSCRLILFWLSFLNCFIKSSSLSWSDLYFSHKIEMNLFSLYKSSTFVILALCVNFWLSWSVIWLIVNEWLLLFGDLVLNRLVALFSSLLLSELVVLVCVLRFACILCTSGAKSSRGVSFSIRFLLLSAEIWFVAFDSDFKKMVSQHACPLVGWFHANFDDGHRI